VFSLIEGLKRSDCITSTGTLPSVLAIPASSAHPLNAQLQHGRKSIIKVLRNSTSFTAPLPEDINYDIVLCGKALGIFVGISGLLSRSSVGDASSSVPFTHHFLLKRKEWLTEGLRYKLRHPVIAGTNTPRDRSEGLWDLVAISHQLSLYNN
jgi:hypothetical protein